jgi:hypothetical protein
MKTILQIIFRFPISILAIFLLSLDVVKIFPTQILDDNFHLVFFFIFFGGIFTQLLTECNAFWKSKKLLVYSIFSLIFFLYLVFYYLYIDWGYPFIGYKIFTFIFAIPLLWLWKHQTSFFLLKKWVKNDEETLEIRKSFLDFTLHLLYYGVMSVLVFIVTIVCLFGINALLNYLFSTEYLTPERIARWIAFPFAATFFLYSIPKYTQKVLQVNFLFRLFFSRIFPIFLAFYLLIVFAYFSKIIFLQEKNILLKEHVYIFMIISLFWWFLSARLIPYKNVFFHYFHRYFFWAFFIFMILNYYFYYVEITIWSREVVFVSIIYFWGILLSIYFLIYGVQKIIHFPFLILILIWILSFHKAFFLLKNRKNFRIIIEKEHLRNEHTKMIDIDKTTDLLFPTYIKYFYLAKTLVDQKQNRFLFTFVEPMPQDSVTLMYQKRERDNLILPRIITIPEHLKEKLGVDHHQYQSMSVDSHQGSYLLYDAMNIDVSSLNGIQFEFNLESKEIIALRQLEDYVLKIENDQIQLFKEDMQYIDIKLSDLTMKDFYSIEKKNILITSLKFDYTDRIIKIKSIKGEFIVPH